MAISENELLRKLRGRIGDLIIYQSKGKTCVRRMPEQVTLNPVMLDQQERYAGVAVLYQALKAVGLHEIWRRAMVEEAMSGYNWFVKCNCPAFTKEGCVGDFGKVFLSCGDLPLPDGLRLVQGEGNELALEWEDGAPYPGASEDDRLVVALMRDGRSLEVKVQEGEDWLRERQRVVIRLPTEWKDYRHLFCFFCSAAGDRYSWSRYFLIT